MLEFIMSAPKQDSHGAPIVSRFTEQASHMLDLDEMRIAISSQQTTTSALDPNMTRRPFPLDIVIPSPPMVVTPEAMEVDLNPVITATTPIPSAIPSAPRASRSEDMDVDVCPTTAEQTTTPSQEQEHVATPSGGNVTEMGLVSMDRKRPQRSLKRKWVDTPEDVQYGVDVILCYQKVKVSRHFLLQSYLLN
jgi:hypothetical protein